MMTPILTAINLDNNNIEHIASDPFQYCWNLTDLSLAYNRIGHLSSGIFNRIVFLHYIEWNAFNAICRIYKILQTLSSCA